MEKEYYTVQEVMEKLGVTRNTLINWKKKGILVPIKIGNVVRYPASELQKIK